ncbi:MAG: hypothetical protein IKY67_07740 [Paludibacteraceae bacterium]|nr:hypothetical protein [Paludibacteraceae bacterium]
MKKLIFFISLSLLTLVGCEKNYERTIWVNPDVECCGVKDPINNIEWLKDLWDNRILHYFQDSEGYSYFLLYRNKKTSEDFIVHCEKGIEYRYITALSCNRKTIFHGSLPSNYKDPITQLPTNKMALVPPSPKTEPISLDVWNNFLNENTLIDTIAYYIVN